MSVYLCRLHEIRVGTPVGQRVWGWGGGDTGMTIEKTANKKASNSCLLEGEVMPNEHLMTRILWNQCHGVIRGKRGLLQKKYTFLLLAKKFPILL